MHSAFSRCTEESYQAAPQEGAPELVYTPLESGEKKGKVNCRFEDRRYYSTIISIIINDVIVGYLVQVDQDAGY